MSRVAVVLFNLGGPDSPEAVKPFLFNLFNDPAIIGLPSPFRFLLAKLISGRRAPIAREIYAKIGGKSPLLEQTEAQAAALTKVLVSRGFEVQTHVAMRYWKPFAGEALAKVKAFAPDHLVLLPLYPQYSKTTSGSSLKQWREEEAQVGLTAKTHVVCCYPTESGFVSAVAALTAEALERVKAAGQEAPRILFSAHGLPKKVVEGGDPYQGQVEATVTAVVARLNRPDLEHQVCYQSRVGPLEWIGPGTDQEIERAGAEGKALVIVPIAFVSEHSETLVELDLEYGELAKHKGVPHYERVSTVQTHPLFIDGLATLVSGALTVEGRPCSHLDGRLCPLDRTDCPHPGPPLS
ncbi:MAG: ferrochelatase [Rhodospirillum sp.]|nr:ferrochelatase [Rhodospirillum sp.]MCF8491637.1 ferrochelatase [Rhodospirillum sp.]MCF8500122.1 ferrochelatase [Rhodospirillum sp.]